MVSAGKGILLAVCGVVAITGFAVGVRGHQPSTLDLVKGFHGWKKANSVPTRLSTPLDLLCAAPSNMRIDALRTANPHFDRYIQVFVNAKGESAMMKGGTFPVGSMIVKEKHNGMDGPAILSTVMIKREKGYNSTCGDWEFASLDASGEKVTVQGKLDFCMKCHKDVAKKDFVFRSYVGMKKGEFRGSAAPDRTWNQGG